ncbi:hypothetical protein J6590_098869, partial [Homalodisca vitripennis]
FRVQERIPSPIRDYRLCAHPSRAVSNILCTVWSTIKVTATDKCSNTPLHNISTTIHYYTTTLIHHYTTTPILHYTTTSIHHYTTTPIHY